MRKESNSIVSTTLSFIFFRSGKMRPHGYVASSSAIITLILLIALIFIVLLDHIFRPGYFTIEQIQVEGKHQRVSPSFIEKVAWNHVSGNYFSSDLGLIEKKLRDIPGIYNIAIRRVWPSSLHISVTESAGLAKWFGFSAGLSPPIEELLNLPPQRMFKLVPVLSGPIEKKQDVLSTYLKADSRLWPLGLEIVELRLSESRDWEFKITTSQPTEPKNFYLVVGPKNPMEQIDDFVVVFELALRNQVDRLEKIDLRYSNGLAVKWESKKDAVVSKSKL